MTLLEYNLVNYLSKRLKRKTKIKLTKNLKSILRLNKNSKADDELRIAEYFAIADKSILDQLLNYLNGIVKNFPPEVRMFANSIPIPESRQKQLLKNNKAKGEYFDLDPIANRLNLQYFNNRLDVKIRWGRSPRKLKNRRIKRIRLGYFDPLTKIITINKRIDSPTVIIEYLELIIYHEMLHLEQFNSKSKQLLHNKEFKLAEKRYVNYKFAIEWEKANLIDLLMV
ncbi:MAG: hypothetical protein ACN4E2_07265 [Nitrospinota bacterium]